VNPGPKNRIKRFTAIQRLFHLGLMLTFATQAATGLARMFIETVWGQNLASVFGGYEGALAVHKVVGLVMIGLFVLHVLYVLARLPWRELPRALFRPDSMLPRPADAFQFFRHLFWMLGLSRHPEFHRYGYWEKFDYWAVFWGMVILGATGLLLYDSVYSSTFMSGWGLNLAFWIHRIEAALAIVHVFIIHFFIGHLRRENFPMDTVMFEGSVPLEKARHEKPAWVSELTASGRLDKALVGGGPLPLKVVYYCFGLLMVAACLYLLIGGLTNSLRVTW
jgi:cytochrome b subunit of formate dehydrogenase